MTATFELFTDEKIQVLQVQQTLMNHIDVDTRFSEARCAKALPMAFASYKEGLQSHYLAEVHSSKVCKISFISNFLKYCLTVEYFFCLIS